MKLLLHFWLNRRAVTVVRVVRQFMLCKRIRQDFLKPGLQRGDVKESRVIEPDLFTGTRMLRDEPANLSRGKVIFILPFALNLGFAAIRINGSLVRRLKSCLPG